MRRKLLKFASFPILNAIQSGKGAFFRVNSAGTSAHVCVCVYFVRRVCRSGSQVNE